MRLYATNKLPKTPFDPYIDKDIWVHCTLMLSTHGTPAYVRFLGKDYDDTGIVLYVNYITDHAASMCKYGLATITHVLSPNLIHLDTPEITCTTEELLPNCNSNPKDIFDEFAGQDVWILVDATHGGYNEYIKILEIKNNSILCKELYADAGVGGDIFFPDELYKKPSEYIDTNLYHIDYWKIHQPLDILTGEEFEAILKEYDEYWEQFNN